MLQKSAEFYKKLANCYRRAVLDKIVITLYYNIIRYRGGIAMKEELKAQISLTIDKNILNWINL